MMVISPLRNAAPTVRQWGTELKVHNLFRVGRHLLRAANYRLLMFKAEVMFWCQALTALDIYRNNPDDYADRIQTLVEDSKF
jgi:hypothetical protein